MSAQGRRLASYGILGGGALVYVMAVGLAAARLTFYWDDHFFVLTLLDRGLGGALTTGINGHWWPLATLILYVQTRTFGFWYPGYIVFNAVIVLWTVWLAWRTLAPVVVKRRWVLVSGLAIFATSFGVVVNILVITTSWPLSVALAMLAALLMARGRPWWTWTLALGLSLLAGSGLFLANMVAASAIFIVARSGGAPHWRCAPRDILKAVLIVGVGALGTLTGYLISRADPIDYYPPGTGGVSSIDRATLVDVLGLADSVLSNTIAWAASPVLPGSLLLPKAMPWLMILVSTYLTAVILAAAISAAFLWHGLRRNGPQWFASLRPRIPALLILLVPTATVAMILSVLRSGSVFAPRFWLLWLIPATALWAVLLEADARRRIIRAGAAAISAILGAAAVAGVLAMPWTLRNAADVDRARWIATDRQVQQAARCLEGLPAVPVAEIAPAVSAEDYCRMVVYLHEESLTGRIFSDSGGNASPR